VTVSEEVVIRKLTWRLLPILMFAYFIAILDRANVGVAALTMNQDLGLSTAAFGFAAGVHLRRVDDGHSEIDGGPQCGSFVSPILPALA